MNNSTGLPTGQPPARLWAIWAGLVALYLGWGSTYLAIRFAVESLPPFLMAGVRFLIAGAVLYAWRRARGDAPPSGQEFRAATIVGLFLLVGGSGAVVWAEQRVTSSVASLLIGTVPLWMVVIDALLPGGQRPGWRTIAGVLVGFAGVVLLIGPARPTGEAGGIDLVGAVALILGSFLWSVGSLYSRHAPLPSSPLLATSVEMSTGGAALILLGSLTGEWARLDLGAISARSLGGFIYLVVVGSWVGFTVYTWLLRVAPTPLVSTYAYVNPLVAMLLGHLLAGESLTLRGLLAAGLVLGSVALVTATRPTTTVAKRRARREPVPAEGK